MVDEFEPSNVELIPKEKSLLKELNNQNMSTNNNLLPLNNKNEASLQKLTYDENSKFDSSKIPKSVDKGDKSKKLLFQFNSKPNNIQNSSRKTNKVENSNLMVAENLNILQTLSHKTPSNANNTINNSNNNNFKPNLTSKSFLNHNMTSTFNNIYTNNLYNKESNRLERNSNFKGDMITNRGYYEENDYKGLYNINPYNKNILSVSNNFNISNNFIQTPYTKKQSNVHSSHKSIKSDFNASNSNNFSESKMGTIENKQLEHIRREEGKYSSQYISYREEQDIYTKRKLNEDVKSVQFEKIKDRLSSLCTYNKDFEKYKEMSIVDLHKEIKILRTYLVVEDVVIAIAGLIVVTVLYFEHFEYLKNYDITNAGQILRIICLIISILTCILIAKRNSSYFKFENLKYICLVNNRKNEDNYLKNTILEIVVHLIQPYPYLSYDWKMDILGNDITYNINMFLFLFSMLRIYSIFMAFKIWNYYSSEQSLRLLRFLKYKYQNLFFLKSTIYDHSYLAIFIIFCITLYIFALIFKIIENTDSKERYNFDNFYNCIWFLVSTMTGLGYGDYFPTTQIGRFVGVFCCFIGTILLGITTSSLILMSSFTDDEKKVGFIVNIIVYITILTNIILYLMQITNIINYMCYFT